MAKFKNQHFIPQFHLRNFAHIGGKSVSIYLKNNNKIIQSASISDQASKDYFYSKNNAEEVELFFKGIEDVTKLLFKTITDKRFVWFPELDFYLKMYIQLLKDRTLKSANKISDSMVELLFKKMEVEASVLGKKDIQEILENVSPDDLKFTNTVNLAIEMGLENLDLLVDLRLLIIENETKIPFFISDNPTVLYNRFYEDNAKLTAGFGLTCAGLQIFLPVNPRYTIMLFDYSTYNYKGMQYVKKVYDKDVIRKLNLCQYLNSESCLYFSDTLLQLKDFEYYKKEAEEYKIDNYKNKIGIPSLMFFGQEGQQVDLRFSFLTYSKIAKNQKFPSHMACLTRRPLYDLMSHKGLKIIKYSKLDKDVKRITKQFKNDID